MRGLLCTALAVSTVAIAAAADLIPCVEAPARERPACLDRWVPTATLGWRDWRDLEQLLDEDPSAALHAFDALVARHDDTRQTDVRVAARLQDSRGRALGALDRWGEAADAFLAALRLDEGTVRVAWVGPSPEADRIVEVDPGRGRLERAAQALTAAGRVEEARPLALRAMTLGSGDAGRPAGLDEEPTPLSSLQWFHEIPEIPVEIIDGPAVSLPFRDAKVTIVDFWASWCVPCAEELPRLQQLHDEQDGEGLEIVTFNVGEPAETARMFAEAIGLRLPVAIYDRAAGEVFDVQKLPTVVVLDRLGRVRGRWNGYEAGTEERIAQLVGELLDDEIAIPTTELGEVLLGAGLFGAEWVQEFPGSVEGMALVPPGEDEEGARILLVASGGLFAVDAKGSPSRRRKLGPAAGLLRRGDLDGDGVVEWLSFRRGATRILRLDVAGEVDATWEAPSPVLAIEAVPPSGERAGEWWIATTGGLFRAGRDGPPFDAVDGFESVLDVAVRGEERLALGGEGRVSRLGADAAVEWSRLAPIESDRLVSGPDPGLRPAVVSSGVTAWAAGRFLDGESGQIALATAGGQLLILDAGGGEVVFRARWTGIRDLLAGDVDGDGRDDLVVAFGSRVALLRAIPDES